MRLSSSFLLSSYVTKEFMKNFLVSFFFFFVIFFINSILLLVQKILLKNISLSIMIEMVLLYMPQFLVYTFPFATLTASSMVLGDLSSSNELLALRSLGLERTRIYIPLIILSLFFSLCTYLTSDVLQPYTSVIYRDKLSKLMVEMPTMEIESNSINNVGNIILSNGKADGDSISDILLITKDDESYNKTVSSSYGTLEIIDPYRYVYALTLFSPEILISDTSSYSNFSFTKADEATIYLDFSSQIPSLTNTSSVNLSSKELIDIIKERNTKQKDDRIIYYESIEYNLHKISSILKENEKSRVLDESQIENIENALDSVSLIGDVPVNYYGQYYKSVLAKKFALSLACFAFTLLTLPLSNVRVKHGKLTGFAISILIAVLYWYMLFASQLLIFDISFDPYIIIFAPDLLIILLALILIYIKRKGQN